MKRIIILPVGSVDTDIFRKICHGLASTFHVKIEEGQEVPIPTNSYNPRRGQYHATTILKKMKATFKKNYAMILGVIIPAIQSQEDIVWKFGNKEKFGFPF